MHNKDKVILDKKLPYEYNICLYILEELCDKGVIDVFEMTEAIFLGECLGKPEIKRNDSHKHEPVIISKSALVMLFNRS